MLDDFLVSKADVACVIRLPECHWHLKIVAFLLLFSCGFLLLCLLVGVGTTALVVPLATYLGDCLRGTKATRCSPVAVYNIYLY